MNVSINFSATLTPHQADSLLFLLAHGYIEGAGKAYGLHGTVAKNLERLGLVTLGKYGCACLTHMGCVVAVKVAELKGEVAA